MGEDTLIEVKNLRKSFKNKKVLDNLNLKINKGKILGIIGPSGEGKSVLIKTLIGFYKPTLGEITYNIPNEKINFSMQNNSLYKSLTVKQNWNYFSKINGIKRKTRKKRIDELLKQLNLEEFKNTVVRDLSGGTKKRTDIGCALLTDPNIIILDEPFTGLDQELVKTLARYALLLKEQGKAIIIVSHRIKLMSRICDEIFLLKNKCITKIDKDKIWEKYDELE